VSFGGMVKKDCPRPYWKDFHTTIQPAITHTFDNTPHRLVLPRLPLFGQVAVLLWLHYRIPVCVCSPLGSVSCLYIAVVGKSVSHHHRHSAWQRTELRRVYGDTGMTEMDWATGADGDTGVTEMDGATGSIYSGDPGVDRLSSHRILYHLIIQRITHSIFPIF